jgi:hypothetical protein
LAKKERNEIDGSEGAIITLWLIRECASYVRRPFVMISRCNGVRANNSCRELLVLLSAQKYTFLPWFRVFVAFKEELPNKRKRLACAFLAKHSSKRDA